MNSCSPRWSHTSGAAAVEFAIVVPILLLLVGGIIDFGLLLNTQISLTHAAREGVRVESLGTGDGAARALASFTAAGGFDVDATVVTSCDDSDQATVRIEAAYSFFILPFDDVDLVGEAVMRCNG